MVNEILEKESLFHDNWANEVNIDEIEIDSFFEACTAPENRIILKKLGSVKDKKILDLGCGLGESSIYFAKKGGIVTACDCSQGMLNVVKKLSQKYGLNIDILKSYSDNIPVEDEAYDIVYSANLLHHVDIEKTLKEVRRVLKKDGIFVSWDPLAHNPIINIYRKIADKVRTEDEHPLKISDLEIFKKYFKKVEFETTWLFTLWIFLRFYLIERVDPNKERYWKKIINEHKRLEKIYYPLERFDKKILKIFPFLKKYCWNIVIFCKK